MSLHARRVAGALALVSLLGSPRAHAEDPDDGIIEAPVCSSTAIETAHRAASSALVEVRAPSVHGFPTWGLGFSFGSGRWVATALHLVENGRGIEVVSGEDVRQATLIAAGREHGVAILRLDRPLAATPLVAAKRDLSVGEPLLALGYEGWGQDADVVVSPGIVTARRDEHVRSDALAKLPASDGAPVLDCAGDLVGIASRAGGYIAHARTLSTLGKTIDDGAEPIEAGWSLAHPMVGFLGQIGASRDPASGRPDAWFGGSVGTALIGDDRWYIPFEARFSILAGPPPIDPLVERSGSRLQLHTGLGYRFMLSGGDLPIYLTPVAGAALSWERVVTRGATLSLDACARGGRCDLGISVNERVDDLMRVMPTAGLKLQIGAATFGYELQLDVIRPDESIHQFTFGFQF